MRKKQRSDTIGEFWGVARRDFLFLSAERLTSLRYCAIFHI